MTKIGIFGGTFNPPHMGHLIICQSILAMANLQKIIFVPSAISPHKREARTVPGELRLRMTKMAIEGNGRFEVSDLEIKRGGVSYTVDTLREIKEVYPHASLFLIIGVDNWIEFKSWKDPSEILEMADLLVMNRPGFNKREVEHEFSRNVQFIDVPNIEISGTMIRLNVRSGRSIKYLVPRSVEQYITEHGLYHG